MSRKPFRGLCLLPIAVLILSSPAHAGPPLLCQLVEIGDAKSLPWGDDPFAADKGYDTAKLIEDTLGLLAPETAVLVRMETLRRAAIYASGTAATRKDPRLAWELLSRLQARALDGEAGGKPDGLAWFDAGYFAACCEQSGLRQGVKGYEWVARALRLRAEDPAMEFAAAIIAEHPKRPEREGHLKKAVVGAAEGSLLAKNIATFGERWGWGKWEDLRARFGAGAPDRR